METYNVLVDALLIVETEEIDYEALAEAYQESVQQVRSESVVNA